MEVSLCFGGYGIDGGMCSFCGDVTCWDIGRLDREQHVLGYRDLKGCHTRLQSPKNTPVKFKIHFFILQF